MMNGSIDIGDICKVVPHDREWETVGAISLFDGHEIVWIPRDSFVLVTNVFENAIGSASWYHVLYQGHHAEISSDLLEPSYEL